MALDMGGACFTSDRSDWETPKNVIDAYGPFDLDVCASKKNAKAKRFFTKKDDALNKPWKCKEGWMNPPYGKYITGLWVKKAWDEECQKHDVSSTFPYRYEVVSRVRDEG